MINFSGEYEVKDFATSKTKKDIVMGNLTLINSETKETLDCKIWENILNTIPSNYLRSGNIVKIVDGDYNEQYKNCIIKELKLISEAPIGLDESTREKLFNDILAVIDSFKDEKLKTAVSKKILENSELFKISPAAKTNHHNYVGGLMQHITECIEFAKALFPVFNQEVNHETILAGCIMHDIGKMFEYKIDLESGLVEIDEQFKKDWISHTQYGFSWAMNNDFKLLAKMIAAHHARSDWEAIIDLNTRDLEPELYLMHHIDDLSAKTGMVKIGNFKVIK